MQPTRTASVDAVPVSYAQKFIYQVLEQLGSRAPMLQLAACTRIRGPVDQLPFAAAAAALASRHPILCSRLELGHGDVFQRQVGGTPSVEVLQVDGGTSQQVDNVLSARADEPLDLFRENPFKVVVARTGPDEAVLMLLAHHMYADAAALRALLDQYLELIFGDPAHLREASRSDEDSGYLSYARREQRMIEDGTYLRRVKYWLDYLEQADTGIELPGRGPDPALQSAASIPFSLGLESLRTFAGSARRLGVTPFALATAAIFHSLREAAPQRDLMLSVVVDDRSADFKRTIGTFADVIVIRQREQDSGLTDTAVRSVYRDILRGMKDRVPSMYLADHIGWLGQRYAKGFAVNEVSVNYVPMANRNALFDGYEVSRYDLTARRYPDTPYHGVVMRWLVTAGRDSLFGSVVYDSALVRPQAAQAIADSWVSALCGGS